ncbi:hypothetical protein [Streptomyces sp. NPDC046939]|uniref:hypothetical protein n=1 Tax=Streptomyces sp. NPDC046939 TaxID=3155376 RepID=UPI00340A503A
MSVTLYRYPVYLQERDWRALVDGYTKRVVRFRAAAKVAQARRVHDALREAEGDAYQDGDDMKYVLHIAEDDYVALMAAVASRFARLDAETRERVSHELAMAQGDARPVDA